MTWLTIPLALLLVGIARIGVLLFPENVGNNKHYEGDFGKTEQTTKSLDELTDEEHNQIGAWWGWSQGDEDK